PRSTPTAPAPGRIRCCVSWRTPSKTPTDPARPVRPSVAGDTAVDRYFFPAVAVVALIALAYKIPALLRDPRSPTRRALVAMLACLVWAPTVNTPAVYLAFDQLVGVPNLARLVAHTGILGFAVSVQILLLYWTVPQPGAARTWLRLASVAAAATAMTVLFILAPVDESTTEFTVRYGDAPYIDHYMM